MKKTMGYAATVACALAVVYANAARAETFIWSGTSNSDWHTAANWDRTDIPGADDNVVIGAGANVLLTNTTAELTSFTMTGGTLTFTNWATKLTADEITISNALITCAGPFTNNVMSNRVWLTGASLTIASNAEINVDGKGYMGGNTTVAYIGQGPGGGAKGGGYGTGGAYGGFGGVSGEALSLPYGSADEPVYPGSGGGANGGATQKGGDGGGAVRLDFTDTVTIDGVVSANGLTSLTHASGGGSGGGIRIACYTLAGMGGTIRANGGHTQTWGGGGGGGRIAIHYNATAQTQAPSIAISVAPGRSPSGPFYTQGGVGSVWLPNPLFIPESLTTNNFVGSVYGFNAWSPDNLSITDTILQFSEEGFTLTVQNSVLVSGSFARLALGGKIIRDNGSRLPLFYNEQAGFDFSAGNVTLTNGGSLLLYSAPTNNMPDDVGAQFTVRHDIVIHTNSWIFPAAHPTNGGAPLLRMRDLIVDGTNSGINADGLGFQGGMPTHRDGFGPGGGKGVSSGRAAGAGHGGRGGGSTSISTRAPTHGQEEAPLDAGSGGGGQSAIGYAGGGAVRIEAERAVMLNGAISANGTDAALAVLGAGAGGSIFIKCNRLSGNGSIQANGGKGSTGGSGAGGGGRIALWYVRTTDTLTPTVVGGVGTQELYTGEDGTIFRLVLPAPGTIIQFY